MLLGALIWALEGHALPLRLARLDAGFLAVALAATTLQYFVLSARWAVFARELGVPLAYRRALGEYYLSALLNQVLPFGVLGDALRVVRHSGRVHAERSSPQSTPRVLLAAALDRISGQAVVAIAALVSAPELARVLTKSVANPERWVLATALLLFAGAAVLLAAFRQRLASARSLAQDGVRALLSTRALIRHVPLSCVMLLLLGVQFWGCARALGLGLSSDAAVMIIPPVLLAAAVPTFFSGWGVREAAAAALYHLAGQRALEGVFVSVAFGLVSLVSSLPGIAVWWASRWSLDLEKPK